MMLLYFFTSLIPTTLSIKVGLILNENQQYIEGVAQFALSQVIDSYSSKFIGLNIYAYSFHDSKESPYTF